MPPYGVSHSLHDASELFRRLKTQFSALGDLYGPAIKPMIIAPPTITLEGDYLAPAAWSVPLPNAQIISLNTASLPNAALTVSLNPLFDVAGSEMLQVGLNNLGYFDGTKYDFLEPLSVEGGTSSLAGPMIIRFFTDSAYFGVAIAGATSVSVKIDGEYISDRLTKLPVVGSIRAWFTFNFSALKKSRLIELFVQNSFGVGAVAVGPNDLLWNPGSQALKLVADGDSYLLGSSYTMPNGIIMEVAAYLKATASMFPAGGTGYLATSGPYLNALTRITQMSRPFAGKADIALILLGINDPKDASSQPNTAKYYTTLRTLLPNTLIVAMGPWCPTQTSGALYNSTVGSYIKSAVRAITGPWIIIDNIAGTYETSWSVTGSAGGGPWQTGLNSVNTSLGIGTTITSISRTANVVTLNATAHGLITGDVACVVDSGSFNGQYAATVITVNQLTYSQVAPNETGAYLGSVGKILTAGSGTGFYESSGDGTHLNKAGYLSMASKILDVLKRAIYTYPL